MEEPTLIERPLLAVDDILVGRMGLIFLVIFLGRIFLGAWNCARDDAVTMLLLAVETFDIVTSVDGPLIPSGSAVAAILDASPVGAIVLAVRGSTAPLRFVVLFLIVRAGLTLIFGFPFCFFFCVTTRGIAADAAGVWLSCLCC